MQTKQAAYEKAKKYIESGMPTTKAFKKARISAPSYYTYKKREGFKKFKFVTSFDDANRSETDNLNQVLKERQIRILELEKLLNEADQKNQSLVRETNQCIKILQAQKADLDQRLVNANDMVGALKELIAYQKELQALKNKS